MRLQMIIFLTAFMMLTACAGNNVYKHDLSQGDEKVTGVVYKVAEIYKVNSILPSNMFTVLFRCDKDGENCQEVMVNPTTQPGFITALGPAALQGAGIATGGYFIGQGLKQSGSITTNNNNLQQDQAQIQVQTFKNHGPSSGHHK